MSSGLRSAAAYALAAGLQRGILFMLLPLYTRAMPPAEYGTLSIALSITAILSIVFAFGVDLTVFRTLFALKDTPDERLRFIATTWRFLLVAPLSLAIAASGAVWLLFGDIGSIGGLAIVLIAVNGAVWVAASTVPLAVLRADERLGAYLVLTATSAAGTGLFTAIGVIVLDEGIKGWLGGVTLANVITLAVGLKVLPFPRRHGGDSQRLKGTIRAGLPLLPHFASQWALQLLDRSILAILVSASSVGVYSLAANLATPVFVLVQALNQGLMPSYARAGTGQLHADSLKRTVTFQVAGVVAICLAGALMMPPTVAVFAPAEYGEAAVLVPWFALGFLALGLYYIPMNGATLGANRGKWAWPCTIASAATNVTLLFVFVPRYGIEAAAIATAVSYAVLLGLIAVYAVGRGNPVQYDWRRIGGIAASGAAVYAVGRLVLPDDGASGFVAQSALVVTYVVALMTVLRQRHRAQPTDAHADALHI